MEGKTGWVCRPRDATDLAQKIAAHFESELFRDREARRQVIRDFANERYSWTTVAEKTRSVYESLVEK